MWETWVQSLDREDPLEKEMTTHSSTLAWKIPWSLVGYSPWGRYELDTTEQLHLTLPYLKTYFRIILEHRFYKLAFHSIQGTYPF